MLGGRAGIQITVWLIPKPILRESFLQETMYILHQRLYPWQGSWEELKVWGELDNSAVCVCVYVFLGIESSADR